MVESNALEIALELENLAAQFPQAVEAGLNKLAEIVPQDVEREIFQGTYRPRIPSYGEYYQPKTRHRGSTNLSRPAWERSNDLLSGVATDRKTGELRVFISGPAAEPISGYPGGYAERVQELPDGRDGVNRSNTYWDRAVQKHEEQWVAVAEQVVYEEAGL